jgi:hypothetical protein
MAVCFVFIEQVRSHRKKSNFIEMTEITDLGEVLREKNEKTIYKSIFAETYPYKNKIIISSTFDKTMKFFYNKVHTNVDSCLLGVMKLNSNGETVLLAYIKISRDYPVNEMKILKKFEKYKDDYTIMTLNGFIRMRITDPGFCCFLSRHFEGKKPPMIVNVLFLYPYGIVPLGHQFIENHTFTTIHLLKCMLFGLSKLQKECVFHMDLHINNITFGINFLTNNFSVKIGNAGYDNIIASKTRKFYTFTLIDYSRSVVISSFKDIPWIRFCQLYRFALIDNILFDPNTPLIFSSSRGHKFEKKIEELFANSLNKIKKNLKRNFALYSGYLYYIDIMSVVSIFHGLDIKDKGVLSIVDKLHKILSEGLSEHFVSSNPPNPKKISELYGMLFKLEKKSTYKFGNYIVPS